VRDKRQVVGSNPTPGSQAQALAGG